MITTVKKQHYVWQHYLQAWTSNNKIYCKRGDSVFLTSTENVAQERYFYEAQLLNDAEIYLIRSMIKRFHPSAHSRLHDTFNVYLVISKGDEHLRRNGLETFHSIIENKTVPIINSIRENDFKVIDNKQTKIDFSNFLGRQYTRTKKLREKKIEFPNENDIPKQYADCDLTKVSEVMSFLLADNIGNWIYSKGIFNFLINQTENRFITCDQPIYNFLAKENEEPTEFDLYYPISPKIALRISQTKMDYNIIDSNIVDKYNNYIKTTAHENIFAISRKELS